MSRRNQNCSTALCVLKPVKTSLCLKTVAQCNKPVQPQLSTVNSLKQQLTKSMNVGSIDIQSRPKMQSSQPQQPPLSPAAQQSQFRPFIPTTHQKIDNKIPAFTAQQFFSAGSSYNPPGIGYSQFLPQQHQQALTQTYGAPNTIRSISNYPMADYEMLAYSIGQTDCVADFGTFKILNVQ